MKNLTCLDIQIYVYTEFFVFLNKDLILFYWFVFLLLRCWDQWWNSWKFRRCEKQTKQLCALSFWRCQTGFECWPCNRIKTHSIYQSTHILTLSYMVQYVSVGRNRDCDKNMLRKRLYNVWWNNDLFDHMHHSIKRIQPINEWMIL